jgi:putative transposase
MGYHPRIECSKIATFQTTRSRNSELWFVNNDALEKEILSCAAKCTSRYGVSLYALAIEGNHIHFPALFPNANRAHFMRDFNSQVARAVNRHQDDFPGGALWARRYSAEFLPDPEDIEEQFFYTVLQPVQDGLVDDISQYPGYNCFEDAITGTVRSCKSVDWKRYNDARRWDKDVNIEDFVTIYELKYERLPGYQNLSSAEYEILMRNKLRERTAQVLRDRKFSTSMGASRLRKIRPGTRPLETKTSTRLQHRPRVLCKDNARRAQAKAWYFSIYFDYKEKSQKYRGGDKEVKFPEGTYKPPVFTCSNNEIIAVEC